MGKETEGSVLILDKCILNSVKCCKKKFSELLIYSLQLCTPKKNPCS